MQGMASGYALGELLAKLNLQPDFDRFDASGTPAAMINNFTRLHPTLKSLGVKFNSNTANALIRRDRGVALQLLYNIKRARSPAVIPQEEATQLGHGRIHERVSTTPATA
jgi:CH-like domain in sperm protein